MDRIAATLRPAILHLGASTDLLQPKHVSLLKGKFDWLCVVRSIPVIDEESISIAQSYDSIADMLLLDTEESLSG
jgi:phosphoribosylanthranilate isomerase